MPNVMKNKLDSSVESDKDPHSSLRIAQSDWKALSELSNLNDRLCRGLAGGGFSPGGPEFSVARGLVIGYEVTGRRSTMLHSTQQLLPRLAKEAELLSYDYW